MAGRKMNVVISQAPGKNPNKRHLEEEIATRLMLSGKAEVSVIPHLYDLKSDHTGMLWLKSLKGDLIVLGWLYPRAIRWVLDRNGVKGKEGESRLNIAESGDDDDDVELPIDEAPTGIGALNVPNRMIYAIDLRNDPDPKTYIAEVERLADVVSVPLVQLTGLFGSLPLSNGSGPVASNGAMIGELAGHSNTPANGAKQNGTAAHAESNPAGE